MKENYEYVKVNVGNNLYKEIRAYCNNNGIRLIDFVEDALERALYYNEEKIQENTNSVKIFKNTIFKNKSNLYSPINLYKENKVKYPNHIIFVQCGSFFEIYNEDASACSKLFEWKTFNRGEHTVAGIPTNRKDITIKKLRELKIEYIFIEQEFDAKDIEYPIKRKISEIFSI
jgi:hypothetical protein